MADYLTANAVFVCNQGGIIRCGDGGNKSVTHGGKELLTTGATVKSKSGICATLTAMAQGTPQACKCQLTTWLPGFSPMKTSNGKALLTDSAKNSCPVGGGVITVKMSGVFKKIVTGNAVATNSPAVTGNASPAEKSSTVVVANSSVDTKTSADVNSPADAKTNVAKKFLCHDCNRRTNCEYFMAGDVASHELPPVTRKHADNDDNDLRRNYFQYLEDTAGLADVRKNLTATLKSKSGDPDFYRRLVKIFQSKGNAADRNFLASLCRQLEIIQRERRIPWGYEAHHLIPIDEVFAKCPKAVLVANLGKFDSTDATRRVFNINGAENCIMLLSYNRDKRFETFFDCLQKNFVKRFRKFFGTAEENATYELMKAVERELEFKIQWHVGQHTYTFKKSEVAELTYALSKKIRPPILHVYEDVVYQRLLDVEDEIDLKKICPRRFRENVLSCVNEIRDKLSDFARDPLASYPYFVTKSNWYYALGVD